MILVTGATGFLGSEVVRQLVQQKKAVRAIRRGNSIIPPLLRQAPVEWVETDILNYLDLEDAMEGVTQVYHCAAVISFKPSERKTMIALNTDGTANIVNLCTEKNIRLIHVSSVAALGRAKEGEVISESNIWEHTSKESGYAISKYQGEMEVWRGIAEGLEAVIVNPSIIIGKNASTGSIRFFDLIKNGFKFFPSGTCGLVDVEDVAKCMISLMESDVTGERFIINSENWSYKTFFEEIALQLGVKPPTIPLSLWMIMLTLPVIKLVSALTGKESPLTPETVRAAFQKPQYSNAKIKKTININFTPLKEAISKTCKNQESE